VRESLERFIRWVLRDLTYHRHYAAKVVLQRADGTLDLDPEDEPMRGEGLQRVPISVALAGTFLLVAPGTRCLFAFQNGDPRKPHVVAWQYQRDGAIVKLADGGAPVARVGDTVDPLFPEVIVAQGIIKGETENPSPPPLTVPVPPPPAPGIPFDTPAGVTLQFIPGPTVLKPIGVIQFGNPKVLA
jgi:hypothetical protein